MLAIHLTKVTAICWGSGCGGLSTDAGRIRDSVCDRGRLPAVSRRPALASRVPLSRLWRLDGLVRRAPLGMQGLRPADVGDRRDDFPRYPHAVDHLVPSDVVGDGDQDGHQRVGSATYLGSRELSDRLGLAPQTPPRHGSTWAQSLVRPAWNRRSLDRRAGRRARTVHQEESLDYCGGRGGRPRYGARSACIASPMPPRRRCRRLSTRS